MKVGPYEVEERLGAGGMGEVFRAYDRRLGRRVALKQIRPGNDADGVSAIRRARLRREAWAAAQISHPNLVQIYDILDDPGSSEGVGEWIVMEFVSGRTLAELVAGGPVSLSQAVGLARQVAEGLAAAHARGVIHRDLKTENVIVTGDGQAKILDFGLAKPVGAGDPNTWTGTGAIVGTVRAMSPEQARGRRVDFRTDLFSLGTLIYELVSGTSPFLDQGAATTLTRVCSHRPPSLSEVRADVPEELSRLVDDLLQKIPEARPESAAVVARRLAEIEDTLEPTEQALRDEDTSSFSASDLVSDMETLLPGGAGTDFTPRPDRWQSETSFSRIVRSRPFLTLGGVLLAVLGVVLVVFLPGAPRTSPSPSGPDPTTAASSPYPSPYDALRRGDALLVRHDRAGHIDDAIEAYDQGLAAEPDYAPALAGKARAAWRKYLTELDQEWLDRSYELASKAVGADPQLARARIALALILIERGEHDEAESELQRMLRLHPSSDQAHWALGRLRARQGDLVAAAESLRSAIELAPENAEYPFELAVVEQRRGDLDHAEELIHRSLELAPDNAFAFYSLGVLSYFRGEVSEAVERFQRSIEIRPSVAAYSNIGTLYFFQGFYSESVGALERAISLGADDPVVWGNLGDAYRWAGGRETEALDAFRRAVEHFEQQLADSEGSPSLQSRLALSLAKLGEAQRSAEVLEAMSPRTAEWNANAALVYRRAVAWELIGERRRALDELSQALEAGYPFAEVEADPELTELRADPHFEPLRTRVAEGGR